MNPIIEVNGDRATGIWYVIAALDYAEDGRGVWVTARHDDVYVKIDGAWKYQHLYVIVRMEVDR
jgi:hypothetical protein